MSRKGQFALLAALLLLASIFGVLAGLVGPGDARNLLALTAATFGLVFVMFAFLTFSEILAPLAGSSPGAPEAGADPAAPAPAPSKPPAAPDRRAA